MTSALDFQIIAFFTILCVGLLGGYFAYRLNTSERSHSLLSFGNTFGGGIFLGAGFIHMLPDSVGGFATLFPDIDYPIATTIAGISFLMLIFVEKVIFPDHEHPGIGEGTEDKKGLKLYPYVLLLVLSVHSIITGIALGVEKELFEASVLFFAVIAHKGAAAFALGTSIIRGGFPTQKLKHLIIAFSLMTPLGLLCGSVLTRFLSGDSQEVFETVFNALAAGSFIYVAAIDILQDELTEKNHRRSKFFFVALGFSVMAILALWL